MTKYKIYDEEGNAEGFLNTETAKFIAADGVLNRDGCTRNQTVFMTPRSKRFFQLSRSLWQGEGSNAREITKDQAIRFLKAYGDVDGLNDMLEEIGEKPITDIE